MSAIKTLYRTSFLLPPHATKRTPPIHYLWRSRLRQSHHFHLAVSRDNSPRCFYKSCISLGFSLTFQGCLYSKQLQKIKIVFPSRAKVSQVQTESFIKYCVLYIQGSSAALQTNCVHIIYLGHSSSPPWNLGQGRWILVGRGGKKGNQIDYEVHATYRAISNEVLCL